MANSLLSNLVIPRKVTRNLRITLNNIDKATQIIFGYITYSTGKLWNEVNYFVKGKLAKVNKYDLYNGIKDVSIHKKSLQRYKKISQSHRAVIYDKTGFKIEGNTIRLNISKDSKEHLKEKHNIDHLTIENRSIPYRLNEATVFSRCVVHF